MDTAFFVASKLGWALIRPDSWIILGFALAVLGAALGWRRFALWTGGPVLLATVALAVWPLGDLLIGTLEDRFPGSPPLAQVDGIIILGGAEQMARSAISGQAETNDGAERFAAAAALARDWPGARLIFTGGAGALGNLGRAPAGNAALARDILIGLGVDPARIEVEDASRNTAENAVLTLPLADPQPGQVWVLVTSAFHMPRAVASFRAAGWPDVVPWPVDHRSEWVGWRPDWDLSQHLETLTHAVREYVGLLAYRMAGR